MSLPVDNSARTHDITDAISRLIVAGGWEKVTMRAIADGAGISVGTLTGHLTNRERILRVCGWRFGRRRLDALAIRATGCGISAFLPETDDQWLVERVWLSWRELGRTDPGIAATVLGLDSEERWMLGKHWSTPDAGMREPSLDALMATIQGLRDAICPRTEERLSLERAQMALAAAASALARSSATIVSGSSAE